MKRITIESQIDNTKDYLVYEKNRVLGLNYIFYRIRNRQDDYLLYYRYEHTFLKQVPSYRLSKDIAEFINRGYVVFEGVADLTVEDDWFKLKLSGCSCRAPSKKSTIRKSTLRKSIKK